ncbi:ABC-three component system middle component 1 [Pseudomonas alliivorans]|uniref:Uncharacterized protein n=1 Tax=Pseudomonas alliivorans TaxID=2810613 RepID=A0ABS4C380_9PSED|nr:ABC-three component system middle component 1 [Pseudomonas alliivorans]MBP0945003.1 hypothetical protein [Pseudomonas alliivorans]MEE4324549.1 ABC-three component system middle component 1 [Pseudomonas alliivorans]MEE4333410.1 ABC-three component system middle component 1 [Pseudomonas alliivorans]MEE4366079.1 ABC-three component system middle component 1 [Pseudomonas alliivorans]
MVTLEELATATAQRAEGRYEIRLLDKDELPEVEHSSTVMRLRRAGIDKAGWRTVLLIELPSFAVQSAHHWAANVRDVLPEPETSDLYMFLVIGQVSNDEATRIETDDRFCRKVVVRQLETESEFLDRTFLASLEPPGNAESLSDPLVSALKTLTSTHIWTETLVPAWRSELLSNANGADVVKALRDSMTASKDQQ